MAVWAPDGPLAARRQDLPPLYYPNGALYAVRPAALRPPGTFSPPGCAAWIMPESRSIDIDTVWDFHLAGLVLTSPHAFHEND